MEKVVIYSRDNCSFCDKAKALMESKKINYTEYKLGVDFTREELVKQFPYQKTYPVILVDNMLIGGYTEFNNYLNEESTPLGKTFIQD